MKKWERNGVRKEVGSLCRISVYCEKEENWKGGEKCIIQTNAGEGVLISD